MKPKQETELGPPVLDWLAQQQYADRYQEVACRGDSVDIVATQARRVLVVELKKVLGLDVIAQAERWLPFAHHVYVATPPAARPGMAYRVCEWLGLGVLTVMPGTATPVRVAMPARLRRRIDDRLLRCLREEQKTFAPAGSSGGRRWSLWQSTCREIVREVHALPGIELKALCDRIKHHYNSTKHARENLRVWLDRGAVEGVELRRERADGGSRITLNVYPKGHPR